MNKVADIERKIKRLKNERHQWAVVFFNAVTRDRMDQAERVINLIDKRLELLESQI